MTFNEKPSGDGIDPAKLERARETLRDAWAWRERASLAWAAGVDWLLDQAAKGRRASVAGMRAFWRRHDFCFDDGSQLKIDNSHGPIVARWLVAEHPELSESIELRNSRFDQLDVENRVA